jgi:hypothetical protein
MKPHSVVAIGCIAALALGAGCSARARVPATDPDPERARAALATLHIDNETPHRLEISYRIAGRSDGQVGIGRVDPDTVAEMAPVPAAEPLILTARTIAGAEHTIPPRTFAIDGSWTWRIERRTRFVPPRTGTR